MNTNPNDGAYPAPTALANSGPKERQEAFDALKEELDDALAELAALRDKALRFDLDQAGIARRDADAAELVELRAELAALRADAERYRWLRDKYTVSLLNGEHELRITYGPRASTKSGIDDIIDAARGGHMTRPRAALGER